MQHLASAAPLWRHCPSNYYNLVCSIWPRQPPSGEIPQATTIIWYAASGLGSPPLSPSNYYNLVCSIWPRQPPSGEIPQATTIIWYAASGLGSPPLETFPP
ncbi:unnamed protein product, partial [Iphiclides podalirius]